MSQPTRIDEAAFRKHSKRAETYLAQGMRQDALASLAAAAAANPDDIPTRLRMVDLHLGARRHNDARAEVMRATSGFVSSPKVALDLVERLAALGESHTVIQIGRQLVPGMWDSARSLAEMARHLTLLGAHDLADGFARAAVAKDGSHPPALFMMATMDVFYGRMESAAEHARRCLAIVPHEPATNWLMSRLRLPDAGPRIDRIRAALAAGPEVEAQVWLWYALHNELHDLKDFAGSWDALSKGCAAKRSQLNYDPASGPRRTWSRPTVCATRAWRPSSSSACIVRARPWPSASSAATPALPAPVRPTSSPTPCVGPAACTSAAKPAWTWCRHARALTTRASAATTWTACAGAPAANRW